MHALGVFTRAVVDLHADAEVFDDGSANERPAITWSALAVGLDDARHRGENATCVRSAVE
jgi:hypothetical protein